MKNISAPAAFFPLLLLAAFVLSCSGAGPVKSVEYRAGKNIEFGPIDAEKLAGLTHTSPSGTMKARVILFRFTTGAEVFQYSGTGQIGSARKKGAAEALVVIYEGGRPVRAGFIRSEGSSREELLSGLAAEVNRILDN